MTIFTNIAVFLIIYIVIIKGIPDITTKFGNLSFIFILVFTIISSIILLQVTLLTEKYKSYAYLLSGISFALIIFFESEVLRMCYKKYLLD